MHTVCTFCILVEWAYIFIFGRQGGGHGDGLQESQSINQSSTVQLGEILQARSEARDLADLRTAEGAGDTSATTITFDHFDRFDSFIHSFPFTFTSEIS